MQNQPKNRNTPSEIKKRIAALRKKLAKESRIYHLLSTERALVEALEKTKKSY